MKINNDICSYMYQILTKWASNYTSKITTKDSSEVFIFLFSSLHSKKDYRDIWIYS